MTPARGAWMVAALLAALATAAPASAAVHLLVVTGVAGGPEYADRYHRWASALVAAAEADGVPRENIVYLADPADVDPAVRARSTRANVERAFEDLADRAAADDEVIVVLIGHGSFDEGTAAFNLPGPDLTAADYARLLARIASKHVAFVDTTSASGAFLAPLAAPGRAIITATATGGESNETRFPQYFVEAFTSSAADRDHDGRVTLREAFDYARGKVAEAYQKDGLIPTEHPALEDGADGAFAGTIALGEPAAAAAANGDPALAGLLEERHQLELQVAALRQRKSTMDPAAYDSELERLLVALASKTREIQERRKP